MRKFILERMNIIMASRKWDFAIGPEDNRYMYRWWIIPRNPIFNIYLHLIVHDDDDRALHDHPWASMSWLLQGDYMEHKKRGKFHRSEGSIIFRWARTAHRLELTGSDEQVVSLFFTGPLTRIWGFHCPKGWIPYKQFVAMDDKGSVGKGCE